MKAAIIRRRWVPRDKQDDRCDCLHADAEREESLAPPPERDAIGESSDGFEGHEGTARKVEARSGHEAGGKTCKALG